MPIARKAYDRVCLDELNINMNEPNNIIRLRLQSLIQNQMSNSIFIATIKYA
jgi:hypothetical protein